jgi:hypothetical protein
MSDKLVFVAAFVMPVEAQLARGLLQAEGIRAFLTGELTTNAFSGVQGLGGRIELQVPEADAERAAEILAPHFDQPANDGDAAPEDDGLWLCPLCGDAVADDQDFCPACDTPRPERRELLAVTTTPKYSPSSQKIQEEPVFKAEKLMADEPPEAAPPELEHDLVVPDMETMVGDDLVRRAFLSALFPLLIPYSLWLMTRLAFYPGKISPRLMTRFYWTIAIDVFWCLCLLMLFLTGLANFLMMLPRV